MTSVFVTVMKLHVCFYSVLVRHFHVAAQLAGEVIVEVMLQKSLVFTIFHQAEITFHDGVAQMLVTHVLEELHSIVGLETAKEAFYGRVDVGIDFRFLSRRR